MKLSKVMLNNSRTLRKNQTKEEKKLWFQFLNKLPVRFWRQKVIENYIVDFCCPKLKLIVELDGSQHYEEKHSAKDTERDKFLNSLGYTVLRYSNKQVNCEFKSVCADIYSHLNV